MADNAKTYANGRCCVFQPFDKGDFDKRYDDVLVPAIEAAGLEPYRVDRDAAAVIPVDTLHKEIQSATICRRPSQIEMPTSCDPGFAIASGKDVVLILLGPNAEKFPFDIQHRGVITYSIGSIRDFKELEQKLTQKLETLLARFENTSEIASASPVKESAGLKPHELTALALLLANSDATGDEVAANWIKQEMRKAGYTELATRLALARLVRLGYAKSDWRHEGGDDVWAVYGIRKRRGMDG